MLIFALSPARAAAKESRERGLEVVRKQNGPYVVAIRILPEVPRLGSVNFTVTVESVSGSALVEGADVEVVATNPDGEPDWLSPAISFPRNPTSYVGDGQFEQSGTWKIEVRVSGPEGEATVEFQLEVRPLGRSRITGGSVALAIALLAAAGGATWVVLSIRRSQRRRRIGR